MGSNPIATNNARGAPPADHEVRRQETGLLSMPARGSIAQRVMSHGTPDKESPTRTPDVAPSQQAQLSAVYRVKPGDNPSTIAQRFDIPLRQLFAANPELEPSKMQAGQAIRIPGIEHNFHIVQKGESFSSVAAAHKVSPNVLRDANPHIEPKNLQIGQALYLPVVPSRERLTTSLGQVQEPVGMKPAAPSRPGVHTIKAGDTLGQIAATHKVSLHSLVEANPGIDPKRLSVGREVVIPGTSLSGAPRIVPTSSASVSTASVPVPVLAPAPTMKLTTEPARTRDVVGHSAEWKPIPVDPRLLDARYVAPLSSEPSSNFFVSAMRTLGHEGGLSESKNDLAHQGGVKVTNYGITGMAMAEYIKTVEGVERKPSAEVLTQRIRELSYAEALDIYASNYWQIEYKSIDKRVGFVLFDWGIIGGARSTLMRVQEMLGVPKTGKMDASTVRAVSARDPAELSARITDLRIARHRERVNDINAKIKKWDDITKAGSKPDFEKPKDQSGFLAGWVERAKSINAYAQSKEFRDLTEVFERTAPQGVDLMDPVRLGKIGLRKNVDEPSLVRMLQQRLTSVGYTVHEDGKFEKEMVAVVNFFQEHYNLPRQPSWGPDEMRILDALMVAKQRRGNQAIASISR